MEIDGAGDIEEDGSPAATRQPSLEAQLTHEMNVATSRQGTAAGTNAEHETTHLTDNDEDADAG